MRRGEPETSATIEDWFDKSTHIAADLGSCRPRVRTCLHLPSPSPLLFPAPDPAATSVTHAEFSGFMPKAQIENSVKTFSSMIFSVRAREIRETRLNGLVLLSFRAVFLCDRWAYISPCQEDADDCVFVGLFSFSFPAVLLCHRPAFVSLRRKSGNIVAFPVSSSIGRSSLLIRICLSFKSIVVRHALHRRDSWPDIMFSETFEPLLKFKMANLRGAPP